MRCNLLAIPYVGALLAGSAAAVPAAAFIQGIYMCTDVFWGNSSKDSGSQCQWLQYFGPGCFQLWDSPDWQRWYRQVSSYGPDPGLNCTVYEGDNCTGMNTTMEYPGVEDLARVGWNDRIASFRCVENGVY